MLKVLIVEDEKLAVARLESLLSGLKEEIEVIGRAESVVETVRWLEKNQADLIFMDIHLSDGMSFGVFEQAEVKAPVIFTTAYDQYAIKAFQLNGIGYLLKPFEAADLEQAMEKFRSFFQADKVDFQEFAKALKSKDPEYQKRFLVYAGDKIQTIQSEQVSYFMAEQKAVFLFSKAGKRFLVDYSLDKLEGLLDPENFFRINRQFIVNISSIGNMYQVSKSRVKIALDPESPVDAIVSVERSPRFKAWLNQ